MGDYKFTKLNDLSLERNEAMDKCYELGEKFIEHFEKIYDKPDNENVNHWCNEMQGWFDKVSSMSLKYSKKLITNDNIVGWFFQKWTDEEHLFPNDKNKQEIYIKFYNELLKIKNVKQSLINIGLIK